MDIVYVYEEYECPGDYMGVFVGKSVHRTEKGARAKGAYLGFQNEGFDWRVTAMKLED